MQPVLIIQHGDDVPPGYAGEALRERNVPVRTIRPDRGEPFPPSGGWSGILVLGGIMGAYDTDEYPWLIAEKALLRDAVAREIPVLGICLGCQLLADALGGSAHAAPLPEARFEPVELVGSGATDAVIGRMTGPVLSFHQDTWTLPPGGELLAVSADYPQAFRFGSAVGMQPHPEVPNEMAAGWIETSHGTSMAQAAGVDPVAFAAAVRAGSEASEALAERIFNGWIDALAP